MALHFACGERKLCQNITKFQNIMNLGVCKILFALYAFINSPSCSKQLLLGWNSIYSSS